ncbi:MAG: hypothetical protein ACI4TD_10905 [Phocaeicola sp.]
MVKTFWSFMDDLKIFGDDVKSLVLYGGCKWGEPSPIPAIVERLSKLDYRVIENIFPYVICNDVAKTRLRNKVENIYNYHLECGQDLAYSDIDKVALYARWLNRFILICGENGMGDVIPLSKQDETDTGGNEPQQYTDELKRLFNGHTDFIDKLRGKDKDLIVPLLYTWCEKTHTDGKPICQRPMKYGNQTGYARGLFESKIIPWENEGKEGHNKDIRNLQQKIRNEG